MSFLSDGQLADVVEQAASIGGFVSTTGCRYSHSHTVICVPAPAEPITGSKRYTALQKRNAKMRYASVCIECDHAHKLPRLGG